MPKIQFEGRRWLSKHGVRVLANLVPLIVLVVLIRQWAAGQFFIDPIKALTVRTGRLAVAFLLLSLACTPVAALTGFARILQARRPLGLWAMGYALLHFLIFAGWDYRFDLPLLRVGIFTQPFIIVGLVAAVLLMILGITSIPALRGTMGQAWPWVQRLVYVAALLDIWHILWAKKSLLEAWHYPAILGLLFLLRIPPIRRAIARRRRA